MLPPTVQLCSTLYNSLLSLRNFFSSLWYVSKMCSFFFICDLVLSTWFGCDQNKIIAQSSDLFSDPSLYFYTPITIHANLSSYKTLFHAHCDCIIKNVTSDKRSKYETFVSSFFSLTGNLLSFCASLIWKQSSIKRHIWLWR